ncbi:TPA: hypothetical protein ACH3X3_000404 [Trebouxia sp. C0006]
MKVSAPDGVKVYNVSSGRSLPAWLSEKKKRSLRKDEEYRRQVELVQDLEFPAACHRLKATPDGQYLFATGIHAPRLRVYELSQLSMKFERHFDAEIVDFQILSDDYSKAAFLCEDRSIHFHAKYGQHYSTRVPSFGRDLAYAPFSADLLVVGSAPEVYRLNLAEGRFLSPLPAKSPGINACGISSVHGLFGCAGDDGVLECFDLRKRTSVGTLNAAAAAGAADAELTAVRFDDTGLHCAVGTSNGLVALYDLRSSRPLLVKDHMYGDKITDIKFHAAHGSGGNAGRKIVSSDSHIVKIWDQQSGVNFTNIEPAEGSINDVCLWKDSGLAMLACDAPKIQAYFVPSLGPAPKWCSFLEGLTEELEETAAPAVYDDYRFVTKAEVDRLGLNHLIGTSLMRAYMHGYFVDNRLWHKARALAEPFAYDTYRQQRVQQKMEQERKSRIGIVKKLPKVNKKMAAQALQQQAADEAAPAETSNKKRKVLPSVLEDDRFKAMFEDPSFAVDEAAEEYKFHHPNAGTQRQSKQLLAEHFQGLEDEEEEEEEDGQPGGEEEGKGGGASEDDLHDEEDDEGDGQNGIEQRDQKGKKRKASSQSQPRMYVAKDESAAAAFNQGRSLQGLQEVPLGQRAPSSSNPSSAVTARVGGQRELTFVPGRDRGSRGRGSDRGRGDRGRGDRGRGDSSRGRGDRGRGRGNPRSGKGGLVGFENEPIRYSGGRGGGRGGGHRGRSGGGGRGRGRGGGRSSGGGSRGRGRGRGR